MYASYSSGGIRVRSFFQNAYHITECCEGVSAIDGGIDVSLFEPFPFRDGQGTRHATLVGGRMMNFRRSSNKAPSPGASPSPSLLSSLLERPAEVRDQIVDVLEPDADADQTFPDSAQVPLLLRQGPVGHARRVLHERLCAAQAYRQGRELDGFHEPHRRRVASGNLEREHTAKPVHLPLRERVLRKRLQPRVMHALDAIVTVEELREGLRGRVLLPDALRQRLQPPSH